MIVIDACVGVKWFLDEQFSFEATVLLTNGGDELITPTLFHIEVASALVRKANIRKDLAETMQLALDALEGLIVSGTVRLSDVAPEGVSKAAQLALDLGHPLKDCIYLALAMELGCNLVTCDARFAAKAKGVWAGVRMLGE